MKRTKLTLVHSVPLTAYERIKRRLANGKRADDRTKYRNTDINKLNKWRF